MRALLTTLLILSAGPAAADVTHAIEGRFGVSYQTSPTSPQGQYQALYEGRFISTFTHAADNGLRFRFDFEIEAGNLETPRREHDAPRPTSVGLSRN